MPSEIYDDLGFNELEFLPLSIRRVLRDNPNIAYPDEFFYHRTVLFPVRVRKSGSIFHRNGKRHFFS